MDLFEDDSDNTPEFTVSELSGAVKRVIEGEFGHVRIRGEVGRVSRPRSGHVYLDLKDDRAVISAVMWKGVAVKQETPAEEGMEVIATGRLTTFPGQSKYQLIIDSIQPAGQGALMAMLEKRKAQLQAEGLFDPARKRELPYLPEIIGVITSPSGAVIRDILHRLRERFPRKVLIWPVAVQGAACAPEVVRAIEGFNALSPGGALPRPDLLIVARGGGSIEDLWGFNEESVARAAAASAIPLISAVGHETDTTLIDFAADRRAPTPSAAAEIAVPVRRELLAAVGDFRLRLSRAAGYRLEVRAQRLTDLARGLPRPETLLESPRQRLDVAGDRLPSALMRGVQSRRLALSDCAGSLRPGLLRGRVAEGRRHLEQWQTRLSPALARLVVHKRDALGRRADRLRPGPLGERIGRQGERLAALSRRLNGSFCEAIAAERRRLDALERLRRSLGYEQTLERGFAVVWSGERVITRRAAAEAAPALEVQFADGRVSLGAAGPGGDDPAGGAAQTPVPSEPPAARKPTRKSRAEPPPEPEQGTLF